MSRNRQKLEKSNSFFSINPYDLNQFKPFNNQITNVQIDHYNKNENPKCNRHEHSALIPLLGYEKSIRPQRLTMEATKNSKLTNQIYIHVQLINCNLNSKRKKVQYIPFQSLKPS